MCSAFLYHNTARVAEDSGTLKTMTSSVFRLSKYVLLPVINEWIESYDLSVFDTACTSKMHRLILLGCLQESYANIDPKYVNLSCLEWIMYRKIIIKGVLKLMCSTNQKNKKTIFARLISISSSRRPHHMASSFTLNDLRTSHVSMLDLAYFNEVLTIKSTLQFDHLTKLDCTEFIPFTDANLKMLSSQAPMLSDVCLRGCCQLTDSGACALITSTQTSLTALNVSDCPLLTDRTLRCLVQHCGATLKRLDVGMVLKPQGIVFFDLDINVVIVGCPQLEDFVCSGRTLQPDATTITMLSDHCPHLKRLYYHKVLHTQDVINDDLFATFTGLEHIELCISEKEYRFQHDTTLYSIAQHCHSTLTSLVLLHIDVSYLMLCAVARSCVQLTALTMNTETGHPVNLNDALVLLSENCTKLTELCLKSYPFLDQSTVLSLLSGLSCLTKLHIPYHDSDCNEVYELIAIHCHTRLVDLAVVRMEESACNGVNMIARMCTSLERLNLSYNNGFDGPKLTAIAQYCTQLVEVSINGPNFTDDAVTALCRLRGKTLRKLNFGLTLGGITKLSVVAIATHCRVLESLTFLNCPNHEIVTCSKLRDIIDNCPLLRDLRLEDQSTIDNSAILYIAEHARSMRTLRVWSRKITFNALGYFENSANCPCLRTLYLKLVRNSGGEHLDQVGVERELKRVTAARPYLEIFLR